MCYVLRGSTFHQKSGECHDRQRKQIKINVLKIKCTDRFQSNDRHCQRVVVLYILSWMLTLLRGCWNLYIITLQWSRAKPGHPASIYKIQSLHPGALPFTPPRARLSTLRKITVMKGSHGGVVMFGPELLFSMYNCCFLACFTRVSAHSD